MARLFGNLDLTTGLTVYVMLRRESDNYRYKPGTGAFAAYTTTRDDFDITALPESPAGTGSYAPDPTGGTLAALVAALTDGAFYTWSWYTQPGGSPSHANDVLVATGEGWWDSTSQSFQDEPARQTTSTTIATELAAVRTDTEDLQARTPAALEGGRMPAKLSQEDIDEITGGISGPGADECTLTINDPDDDPIADADVWLSSDADGDTVVAGTRQTDSNGRVTFMLDDGASYYLWAQKDGINAIEGELFVAEAD
jgi:hypothetical protein